MFIDSFWTRSCKADKVGDFFAHPIELYAFCQIRCNRCKNVTSVKSVADWLQEIVLGGDVANPQALFTIVDHREHAIVRSNKAVFFRGDNDRPALGSYSWINHHEMNCAAGEI